MLFKREVAFLTTLNPILFYLLFSVSPAFAAEDVAAVSEDVIESASAVTVGDTAPAEAVIEEVYVTGSLLPRGNYVSNAPITTIDSDQFEISNVVNVEALLNTLPQGFRSSAAFSASLRKVGARRAHRISRHWQRFSQSSYR